MLDPASPEAFAVRTSIRYCLLQLPGLAMLGLVLTWLVSSNLISSTVALAILAMWVVKDAAMYPLARRVLDKPLPATGAAALIGRETRVARALEPRGLVRIGHERWVARSVHEESIPPGRRVRVVNAEGLVLIVEPVHPDR
jgi:membrane-bound ClpP family serine protease